ncbi:MAG: hypothetical protein ACOYMB_00840 [Patescibacteria group bacterium]
MNIEQGFINKNRRENIPEPEVVTFDLSNIETDNAFVDKKDKIRKADSLEIENLRQEIKAAENENKKEDSLTPERKVEVIDTFKKLKEILGRSHIGENVKNMLLDSSISAVLAGAKPASESCFIKEEKFLFTVMSGGVSKKDFSKFQNIIKEFGCDSVIWQDKRSGLANLSHVDVYNNKNVVKALEESGVFSQEEIGLARNDWHLLYKQLIGSAKEGDFEKAFRGGYVYGYPREDVADYIKSFVARKKQEQTQLKQESLKVQLNIAPDESRSELHGLQNIAKQKKGIMIYGLRGDPVVWESFNPESREVKNKVKELQDIFLLEREIIEG